jgi:serine/threonine-protein kinase
VTYAGTEVLNYRLTEKLGEGGFGEVWLAVHTELPRKVAVKILHPEFSRRKELVDRFFHEATTVCAIGHDNIIDIQNFGRLESGEPFFLMELVPGPSLSAVIEERGPLPPDRLAEVLDPVVSALEAAHAKGIIHRDLKPENIMVVERDGRFAKVKLLDFGIAKLTDSSVIKSRSNIAMGTPQYMAPEQARDAKGVDVRADVYSFGATAYCALAGRPPFLADNLADLIIEITSRTPPPLDAISSVPKPVAAAIAACLAKDPARRPPTIRAAWDRILGALAECSMLPAPPPSQSWPIPRLPPPTTETTPVPPPDRRWLWAVLALGLVGGGAAIAGVLASTAEPIDDGAPPPIDAATPPPIDAATPPPIDAATPPPIDAAPRPPRPTPDAAPRTCDESLCSLEPPPACCARLPIRYSRAEIDAAMAPARAFTSACFAFDDDAGPVRIDVRVARSGAITGVRAVRPASPTVSSCVAEAIRRNAGKLPERRRPGRFRYTVREPG